MHISLTPQLEEFVKAKVATSLYNNSSEVIREALRFMETHEEWIYQLKLDRLRQEVAKGAEQAEGGEFVNQTVSEVVDELKQERHVRKV
ncbi:MAG: type II toxin-antitoxin system ParD family antitoxin [Dehalococcoidia bacterium]